MVRDTPLLSRILTILPTLYHWAMGSGWSLCHCHLLSPIPGSSPGQPVGEALLGGLTLRPCHSAAMKRNLGGCPVGSEVKKGVIGK